ncbi:MAG TPA: hypothetical protein PK683_04115 [Leptospiraceae bacterium]|nr:hypothetical protein [Leptospiraceae bacterium]
MRSMILLIVLFLIECSNQPSKNRQKEEQFGIRQPMFWWMLLANRPKDEDPNCGGDPLETLFGLNKDKLNQFTPLAENQEIVTDFIDNSYKYTNDISYLSSKKSEIQITPIEIQSNTECCSTSFKASSAAAYCSGVKSIVFFPSQKYLLLETIKISAVTGSKNLVSTGHSPGECFVKFKIKSVVL